MIYDRNGNVVVYNRPAYDIMVIPRDIQPFDTLDFCNTLGITRDQLIDRFAEMKDKSKNPATRHIHPRL